jgi:hypothetical protein
MMKRGIAGVAGGLAAWFVAATAVNLLLRVSWPDYAAAEKPMTFTLGMLGSRLATGALSSICAGFTAGWITGGAGTPVKVLAALLLVFFIPVHYGLWDRFPFWYHATFLASLIPFVLLGATLGPKSTVPPAPS